jgi:hypothetical protein
VAFDLTAIDGRFCTIGAIGTSASLQWLDHDLLQGPPDCDGPCAVWSGALTADRFEPSPLNWLPGAREQLARCLEGLPESVLIRPHHAQVLNDVPGTRSMLADRGERPVAIDLAALLAPSMVRDPDPHVDRILHGLAPMAGAILLSDAVIDETGRTRAMPMGEGVLCGASVGQALAQWVDPDWAASHPICVWSVDVDAANAWLGF